MSVSTVYFDIETGPEPDDVLEKLIPAFDPDAVKVGNIKDPDKIAAKIATERMNHRKNHMDKAALSPITGQVLAIGLRFLHEDQHWVDQCLLGSEHDILANFWEEFKNRENYPPLFIGFNINSFDLPFLVKRSWRCNVPVPESVRDGRWWNRRFVDMRDLWQCGDRMASGSLDRIATFFGLDGKNGDGAYFAELFKQNPDKAIAYLENDLRMTHQIHERMIGAGIA